MSFDLVIRGGRVIDGSGNPWYRADVAISEGKVVEVGRVDPSRAERVIVAEEFIVAPGIIDLHAHSDLTLLVNPRAESAVRQGVTTEIVGNCGSSLAPLTEEGKKVMKGRYVGLADAVEWDWSSMSEYLAKLERQGVAMNVGSLVGYGTLRMDVMEFAVRAPTDAEMNEMKRLLAQALEDGAFGFSTGLEYAPQGNATTGEVIELAKVAAEYGSIYVTHMRQRDIHAVESIMEAIEIGEKAGLPVHISHHPVRYPYQGRMKTMLLRLHEDARERGLDITFDVMVQNYNPTSLTAQVPHWMHEGGLEKLLERLKDPEIRKKVKAYDNPQVKLIRDGKWDKVILGDCVKNAHLIGKNFAEIAKIRGVDDPWDAAMEMMIEEGGRVGIYGEVKTDQDIADCLKHPTSYAVGSDVTALAPYGVLAETRKHPLCYGNYARLFERYVREQKVLTLEEAVRKLTSGPAQRIGLLDRGLLRPGMWADIMVFDKDNIRDKATFQEERQFPEGIPYVIVNGEVVVDKGEHTGKLPGKMLRANYKPPRK